MSVKKIRQLAKENLSPTVYVGTGKAGCGKTSVFLRVKEQIDFRNRQRARKQQDPLPYVCMSQGDLDFASDTKTSPDNPLNTLENSPNYFYDDLDLSSGYLEYLRSEMGYKITDIRFSLSEEERKKRVEARRNFIFRPARSKVEEILGRGIFVGQEWRKEIQIEDFSSKEKVLQPLKELYQYGMHKIRRTQEGLFGITESIVPDFVIPVNDGVDLRALTPEELSLRRIPQKRYERELQGEPIELAIFDVGGVCFPYTIVPVSKCFLKNSPLQPLRRPRSELTDSQKVQEVEKKKKREAALKVFEMELFLYTQGSRSFAEFGKNVCAAFEFTWSNDFRKDLVAAFQKGVSNASMSIYDVVKFFQKAQSRPARVVALSDSVGVLQHEFQTNWFDAEYLSHEMGTTKREGKEIFLQVLEKEGVNPENCIFFDDKAENLEKALEIGMAIVRVSIDHKGRNHVWSDIQYNLFSQNVPKMRHDAQEHFWKEGSLDEALKR